MAAGTPSPSADGSPARLSDPFDTLGLPPVFELDPTTLERRHRELSRALHPDRYAGRPSGERQQALGRAIEVNEAFRKLKHPVNRAEALLARHGRAVTETNAPSADPALLMDVMERREALGDARRARDLVKVRTLARAVREREQRVLTELGKAFVQLPPDFSRIEPLLGELRYHYRFLEEALAAEDELDEKPG